VTRGSDWLTFSNVQITMLAGVVGLALALGMQQGGDLAPARDAMPELSVSLTRIHRALDRPAPLRIRLPEPQADFHVEIRRQPLYSANLLGPVESLWSPTTSPAPAGGLYGFDQRQRLGQQWSQPMFAVDLLSIGSALQKAVAAARRSRAEQSAQEEVRRARAEFCATHECPRP
jgi:hypothetical protein